MCFSTKLSAMKIVLYCIVLYGLTTNKVWWTAGKDHAIHYNSADFAGGLCRHETRSGEPMGLHCLLVLECSLCRRKT